ncbi:MAG TPA: Bax inhibitor-1/YccA family protein [Polyangiales bacterium]
MERYQTAVRPLAGSADSTNDILWITYRWMSLGLAITGVVAWLVSQSPAAIQLIVQNRLVFFGLMLAQIGLVVTFSALVSRVGTAAAAALFFTYAALTGLTFSVLFLVYTLSSIASTFFITSATFGGLSLFGAVTKRDLSIVGRFALFAVIGLLVTCIVNIFLQSSGLMWITSVAGVLIFGALTAYDTQALKQLYAESGAGGNLALRGALKLYLDFINMFMFLLQLTGRRR